jgi:ribosomal protein L37AE/L43A
MNEHDYDELVIWQDILDEVMAGRTQGHRCPKCNAPGLEVEKTPSRVYIKCSDCGNTFEGRLHV